MQKSIAKKLSSRIDAHLTSVFAPGATGGADFVKARCERAGWHMWRARVGEGAVWHVLLQTMPRGDSFGVEMAWTTAAVPPLAPMGVLGGGPVYATDATAATPPDQWLPLPRLFLRVEEDEVRSMSPMWHLVRPESPGELARRIALRDFDPPAIAPAVVDIVARHVVRQLASHGVGWLQRSAGALVAVRELPEVGEIDAALLPHVVPKRSPGEAAERVEAIVSAVQHAADAADGLERSHRS